ncbi:hypothetical protein CIB93_27610 [Streptomyces sp. WZ.A104]|uniref:hypothetical protein n=1 Tax=Streptomyces sp. WZ.A104 TaxID=2023771 RepID=UPI000BBB88AC|nr:hypothetical protein [Streptomyces sp. WZ.A104]PCG82855.1 hypothetical protein CIB93_27610 [Streptomyces sp. WZ.A104]
MRLITRISVNTVCALSLFGLAACGAGSGPEETGPFANQSGPEVANKALTATSKVKSLRIGLDMTTSDGRIKADFATSLGGDCTGTMSMGGTGTMEVIRTGDRVYTKLDEALLREQGKGEPKADIDAAVKLIAGRWMESKASDPDAEEATEFCDLKAILKEFEATDNAARKVGPSEVTGKPALRLTEKDGKETFTFDVAAEGEPYLLRVTSKGGEEPMTMNLSDFDVPVVAKKPAAKDMVDLEG